MGALSCVCCRIPSHDLLIPTPGGAGAEVPERDVNSSQRVHPQAHQQHQRQAPPAQACPGLGRTMNKTPFRFVEIPVWNRVFQVVRL